MAVNRTAIIERLIKDSESSEILRVPFRGRAEKLPVIEVETGLLRFNVQNGRLALDRETLIEVSAKNAQKDPDDPEVQKEVEDLILQRKETDELLKHIQQETQLQPGIIARDGTVVNGNRRLAVLRKLGLTDDERFKHMWVGVLPRDATPAEMYLLEVSLQMTPDTREKYGPFTSAVHLRWGIERHKLKKNQVASAMYLDPEEVDQRLQILGMADEYLAFIGQPKRYSLIEAGLDESKGKYQHFFELYRLQEKHGKEPYWNALMHHVFLMIKGGATYDEIRELKKWKVDDVLALAKELSPSKTAPKSSKPKAPPTGDDDLEGLTSELDGLASQVSTKAAEAAKLLPLPSPTEPTDDGKAELPEDSSDEPQVARTLDAVRTVIESAATKRAKKRPTEVLTQALRKIEAAEEAFPGAETITDKEVQIVLENIVDRAGALLKRCAKAAAASKTKRR